MLGRDKQKKLHKIVIVGGGAGGLELATRLGDTLGKKQKAEITLIDRTRTHVWKPLLHEIAAGSMNPDKHELEYLAQAHWHHFTYRYGEMVGLDRERQVLMDAGLVPPDPRRIGILARERPRPVHLAHAPLARVEPAQIDERRRPPLTARVSCTPAGTRCRHR